ncbi:MAG TPA: hypothetical protein VKX24_07560 [Acidimicrobiia bacterium]|nr:hypothetical protein [Acidimicrobiia bacterium]HZQ79567.1 hypothetical protein [Acidimicrobiia bacterium]
MPSVAMLYAVLVAALGILAVAHRRRSRVLPRLRGPLSIHRCRARPLFSEVGQLSFQLDALVEDCDDPSVPRGTPFALRLERPTRRSDYLFSRVRASVERGHALVVDVEDHLTARKARLCANGWTVVLDVVQSAGWPAPVRG